VKKNNKEQKERNRVRDAQLLENTFKKSLQRFSISNVVEADETSKKRTFAALFAP
jgi:hypothetical protein